MIYGIEMKKYQIIVDGEVVKEYPHKLQAVIWCFMHGYGYQKGTSRTCRWIIGAEIREVNDFSSPSHEE